MLLSRGMGSSHFIKVYLLTPTGSLACKPLKLCITSTLHILMGMFPKISKFETKPSKLCIFKVAH